jgi:hypothetical protein
VVKPPAARKRKPGAAAEQQQLVPAAQAVSRQAKASSGGGVYDLWGVEEVDPVRREAEGDFDELAQALAAKARTPYGIVRPAKRRCLIFPGCFLTCSKHIVLVPPRSLHARQLTLLLHLCRLTTDAALHASMQRAASA